MAKVLKAVSDEAVGICAWCKRPIVSKKQAVIVLDQKAGTETLYMTGCYFESLKD